MRRVPGRTQPVLSRRPDPGRRARDPRGARRHAGDGGDARARGLVLRHPVTVEKRNQGGEARPRTTGAADNPRAPTRAPPVPRRTHRDARGYGWQRALQLDAARRQGPGAHRLGAQAPPHGQAVSRATPVVRRSTGGGRGDHALWTSLPPRNVRGIRQLLPRRSLHAAEGHWPPLALTSHFRLAAASTRRAPPERPTSQRRRSDHSPWLNHHSSSEAVILVVPCDAQRLPFGPEPAESASSHVAGRSQLRLNRPPWGGAEIRLGVLPRVALCATDVASMSSGGGRAACCSGS